MVIGMGRVLNNKEKSVNQFEPVAKKNARILTINENRLLHNRLNFFMDDELDIGDLPFTILRAQEVLW
jgi:hypothetical protein